MPDTKPLAFVDLKAQYAAYRPEIDAAVQRVLDHGQFILGPEVAELEAALADYCGVEHVVGCSSGTDALAMMMLAEGVGPGDAVFLPAFTFTATAEVPILLGATPVFVDVDEGDFMMGVADLERRIEAVKAAGAMAPRGILATDLFGLPADYDAIHRLAERFGLTVWSDAAQSLGGQTAAGRVGALARMTATSFYPAKPLGCYGDGGAVFTPDAGLAKILRSIRVHGMGAKQYDIVRVGLNARLDSIQAAVLLAKLPHFEGEIARRNDIADRYDALLAHEVVIPTRRPGRRSAWAQYTVRIPGGRRDAVAEALKARGIPTAVHYPMPLHLQTAYRHLGDGVGSLPVSERLCGEVLSLPMHPFLTDGDIERVAETLLAALR